MEIDVINGRVTENNNMKVMENDHSDSMPNCQKFDVDNAETVQQIREISENKLFENASLYYNCGSGIHEQTLKDNELAFKQYRFRPRILRDVAVRDFSTTVLSSKMDLPFGISPTALHKYAHEDAETGVAIAARDLNALIVCSTFSSKSLEEIAESTPESTKWFQTYIFEPRDITLNLIKRAEKAGFKAIVITGDHPLTPKRPYKYKYPVLNNFLPDLFFGNFGMGEDTEPFNASVTWDDIDWLKGVTALPIVVKGVLTPEDAVIAIQHGVHGIWVSNHGGRQLDGSIATLDALPDIVAVAEGHCEVYVDGGVRHGYDVLKALALGANMVFLGRPIIWGLAAGGERGVRRVLEVIKDELSEGMALTGCAKISDINREMVLKKSC